VDLLILGLWILFWSVVYIVQGRHDVAIVKEIELIKKRVKPADIQTIEADIIKSELSWKFWHIIENLMVKVALTVLIFILTKNSIAALLLFILSIFIRWFVHDIILALGLEKGIRHIGPDWIWTDKVLRRLHAKGINQYLLKLIPIILLTILYWIYVT
jgi:hypothetical protein